MVQQRINQRGFSIVEVLAVVLVVTLVAAGGYMLIQRSASKTATTASSTPAAAGSVSTKVPTAPTIHTAKDLEVTAKTLDDTQLDSSDSAALDSQTNDF